MRWNKSDNKYLARSVDKGLVFRLNYQDLGVYGFGKCYALQVRKRSDMEFTYLGYTFVTKDDGYGIAKKKSVDDILWYSISDIIKRAEGILRDNYLIGDGDVG